MKDLIIEFNNSSKEKEKLEERLAAYQRFLSGMNKKNVTPYNVSKNTGIATSTLSDWKNGKSMPKPDKMQRIADYLDLNLEYLLTGKEPVDLIFTDNNAEFIVEVTKMAKNKEFVERIKKYMSLKSEDKKSIDDMIDFLYNKNNKSDH